MTKILVIDDETIIRERLKLLLEMDGFEACYAESGHAGLEIFEKENHEIVLLDIKMPGIDGFEVLKCIKERSMSTEVIIMTGHGTLESAIEALRKGAFDYLTKPVDYDEMLISIQRALEKQDMVKKLEENRIAIEKVNNYINSIIGSMIDALIVFNKDGNIQTVNQAACNLTGYNETDLKSKKINSLIVEDIYSDGRFEDLSVIGFIQRFDVTLKSKSNENIPVSMACSLLNDSEGNIFGIVAIVRDMRMLMKLFEKEKKLAAAEATAIAEQTKSKELEKAYRDLQDLHIQLLQAGKMAAIGQLAAGISHEINNPLSSVLSHAQLLLKRLEKPELKNFEHLSKFSEYIKLILEGANRCKRIVGDFLAFSRKDEEKYFFRLDEVIEKSMNIVGNQLSLNNIKVKRNYKSGERKVFGNFNRLQQVIINIILNANQFLPAGGEITIETSVTDDGEYIESRISDNGPGIPEENLEKVFEPFFTTAKVAGGSEFGVGLGLSICYNIIKDHGGNIHAESCPGSGATFVIRLPIQN